MNFKQAIVTLLWIIVIGLLCLLAITFAVDLLLMISYSDTLASIRDNIPIRKRLDQ